MLHKLFKSFKYGKKGFTLIELLVVVAILGILAAVAIPNVGKFVNSGKVSAANTELASSLTAAAAFTADGGKLVAGVPAAFTSADLTNYVDSKGFKGVYKFLADGTLDESAGNVPTYPLLTYDTTTHQFK